MKSISKNTIDELNIKKSKFICHLYRVNNIDEINDKLSYINDEYKDATHNCYAYICGNLKKASDNGEPSGTAGIPMLNILEVNNLNYILAVVTRYFGGIKLGANGLIRAYADSVKEALNKADIIELEKGIRVKITFSYDNSKQIDYLLKDSNIINKEYHNEISYIIDTNDFDIKTKLNNFIINYELINEILIEKEI